MAAALLAVAWPTSARGAELPATGVVAVDRLHLRSGPGTDYPPVALLNKGSRVQIVAAADDWLKVHAGKHRGYVSGKAGFLVRDAGRIVPATATHQARDIQRMQEEAAVIDRRIEEHHATLETVRAKETSAAERLEALEAAISGKRQQATQLRGTIAALEARIDGTQAEKQAVAADLQNQAGALDERLVALYKLNRLGTLHVLAAAQSVNELVQRKYLLERILDADAQRLARYREDRQRLEDLETHLALQRTELESLVADHQAQLAALTDDRQQRSLLLEEIRNKKELELAAIESLRQSAAELEAIIGDLTRQQAEAGPAPGGVSTFEGFRGRLEMPVSGKVVTFFGPFKNTRYNVMNFRSGVDIEAERGEPIRAVFTGRVLFADYFKGYGNMLIIDHGHNYCTLYAHLEELFKQKGAPVERGEVVATVGDSGSLTGPGLYFEVRYLGKPEDPLKWFKKG
jgi:septal ring factor EnvC (AmiA/AmiB activator)